MVIQVEEQEEIEEDALRGGAPDDFVKLHQIAMEEGGSWHRVLHDDIIVVYKKKVRRVSQLDKK